jgi:hypothetical protein
MPFFHYRHENTPTVNSDRTYINPITIKTINAITKNAAMSYLLITVSRSML